MYHVLFFAIVRFSLAYTRGLLLLHAKDYLFAVSSPEKCLTHRMTAPFYCAQLMRRQKLELGTDIG
jgi:hypothetical protein